MTNETLTEQLKKLLSKVNSIQGQQLTFAQRLKAVEELNIETAQNFAKIFRELEEKKEDSETTTIPETASDILAYITDYMFGKTTPWIKEVVEDEVKEDIAEVAEVIEETEEIEAEVLEQLDEIIERD